MSPLIPRTIPSDCPEEDPDVDPPPAEPEDPARLGRDSDRERGRQHRAEDKLPFHSKPPGSPVSDPSRTRCANQGPARTHGSMRKNPVVS